MSLARFRSTAALAAALLAATWAPARAQAPARLTDSAFVALVERLSEPSGYFDTDNLISNEDSYLHPIPTLRKLGVTGGVYVGVGPDQNFSYIAAVQPKAAFIVDIRRDNLLEHILFKAMFSLSRNRLDYLGLLFGRATPVDTTGWGGKRVDSLLFYIDTAKVDPAAQARIRARVMTRIQEIGLKLSAGDLQTIARFHSTFVGQGPALRFNTFGRAPQSYYPDYRQLASGLDRDGRQASFLSSEAAFQVVKSLEDRNLVIPLVGDFGGARALAGVAAWMTTHKEVLSAFYTSNVEQYLFQSGVFDAFAANAERMPRDAKSVFIRSCFVCGSHTSRVNGYHAVQVVQLVNRFAELRATGQMSQYALLIVRGVVEP